MIAHLGGGVAQNTWFVGIDGNLGGPAAGAAASLPTYMARRADLAGGAVSEREPFRQATEANVAGGALYSAGVRQMLNNVITNSSYLAGNRMQGNCLTWQGHFDRAAPTITRATPSGLAVNLGNTIGAGDDGLCWGAAKSDNCRWMMWAWLEAAGNNAKVVICLNEPDGNPNRYIAYSPVLANAGALVKGFTSCGLVDKPTALDRIMVMQRAMFEETKGPLRKYNPISRDDVAVCTPATSDGSKRTGDQGHIAFNIYQLLTHNSGEIMTISDGVSVHSYDDSINIELATPGATVRSFWHVWTAMEQARVAAGIATPRHFLYNNEQGSNERSMIPLYLQTTWNHGSDAGDDGYVTEASDAAPAPNGRPIHHAKLPARRLLKSYRISAMATHDVVWAMSFAMLYNFASSPHDSMIFCPSFDGYVGRQPAWTATCHAWDFRQDKIVGWGPWTLPFIAKPWRDPANIRIGFHDHHTWQIWADYDAAEKADPVSTTLRTWHEWDRATCTAGALTFTAPTAGQGIQLNRAIRIVWFPFHGTFTCSVRFSGNTGTARIVVRGHDKVRGFAAPTASSTAASGTVAVTFTHNPHGVRAAPNAPLAAVMVEATAACVFQTGVTIIPGAVVQAPPPEEPPEDVIDPGVGTIRPASYWETQATNQAAFDSSYYLPRSTSNDSFKYYELHGGLDGNGAMYRATGNTFWLDRALLYTENMIASAVVSNNANFPASSFKDGYRGWISRTVNQNINDETPLYESYAWRYVCKLMDIMYGRGVTGAYLTRLNTILAFTETNIWAKWYARGVDSWIYRSTLHTASHWLTIAEFLSRRANSATIRAQATTIAAAISHAGMPRWNNASIRSRLQPHATDALAYYWRSYFPQNAGGGAVSGIPATDINYGADTSHASAVLSPIVDLYDRGYGPWVADDIRKFLRLLNNVLWPATGTFYYWLGTTTVPLGNADIPRIWTTPIINDGWTKLGRYNRPLQNRLDAMTSGRGIHMFGNMAVNAQILNG